jgi:hypothetical protein
VARLSSRDGLCAFALLLWRRRTILDIARRDIDDELGELSGIAGAPRVAKCQNLAFAIRGRNAEPSRC